MPNQNNKFLKKNGKKPSDFQRYVPATQTTCIRNPTTSYNNVKNYPVTNSVTDKFFTPNLSNNMPEKQPKILQKQDENMGDEELNLSTAYCHPETAKEQPTESPMPSSLSDMQNKEKTRNQDQKVSEKLPSFSEITQGNSQYSTRVERIIKMKVVPPLTKEHFENFQLLEDDVRKAMKEIILIFQPKFRQYITISRTRIPTGGSQRELQILMVTAPAEAEEDIAQAQLNGITIMGKTVFPTGQEFWRHTPSNYPKRVQLRCNNLPKLLCDEELKEIMGLPENIQFLGPILRESTYVLDVGKVYTGKASVPIRIDSAEQEKILKEWSTKRCTEDIVMWMDIPIYINIPVLHKCELCEQENRKQVIGHDRLWCRIVRKQKPIENNESSTPQHQQDDIEDIQSNSESEPESSDDDETGKNPNSANSSTGVTGPSKKVKSKNKNLTRKPDKTDEQAKQSDGWTEVQNHKSSKQSSNSSSKADGTKSSNTTKDPINHQQSEIILSGTIQPIQQAPMESEQLQNPVKRAAPESTASSSPERPKNKHQNLNPEPAI